MKKRILMQGNEAVVEGAIRAGMRFFAGYPITPSTEIAEQSAVRLPQEGGHFIQMEDEIGSMAAIIGASAVGVKSMTATSGPGFSLKQENIGYACMAEIPCVIVNVQRSGPSTGLPTSPSQGDVMQARWGTHGDHPVIAISPSSVEECYMLAIKCFNLAEKYRTPVVFLLDEIVGHLREGVEIDDEQPIEVIDRRMKERPDTMHLPYHVDEGEDVPRFHLTGYDIRYNITSLAHGEDGFPTNNNEIAGALNARLMQKIDNHVDDITLVEEYKCDDADTVIVCYGGTKRSVMTVVDTLRAKGEKVGYFRPITVWPFPEKQLKKVAAHAKRILVVEHNYGQILYEVERIVKDDCKIDFLGNVKGTVITPAEIIKKIEEVR